jgi:multidrug transporter EmrE-like cation transporter
MKRYARRRWRRSAISKFLPHELVCPLRTRARFRGSSRLLEFVGEVRRRPCFRDAVDSLYRPCARAFGASVRRLAAAGNWKWLVATAAVQFGYYALLIRSYGLGDMSVVYPLARGLAPVLMTVAALVCLGEVLGLAQMLAVGLVSVGVMILSLGAGAHGVAVWYACATGLAVAAYSLFGGLGVRNAGTVLGFQACLEVVTGGGGVRARHARFGRSGARATTRRYRSFCWILVGSRISRLSCSGKDPTSWADRCPAGNQRNFRHVDRDFSVTGGNWVSPHRRIDFRCLGHRDVASRP